MEDFVCEEVLNRSPVDDTGAVPFKKQNDIERVHSLMPRFGRTNDITHLLNGSKEDGKNYVIGLLSAAIAIFAFFIAWCLALILLRCLGYKRVGFLSGRTVKLPNPPDVSEQEDATGSKAQDKPLKDLALAVEAEPNSARVETEKNETEPPPIPKVETNANEVEVAPTAPFEDGQQEYRTNIEGEDASESPDDAADALNVSVDAPVDERLAEWKAQVKRRERRLRRVRITALVAGTGIWVCVILMIVKGVDSLVKSLDNTQSGMKQAENLAIKATKIADDVLEAQELAEADLEGFNTELYGPFCPNICALLPEQVCLEALPPFINFTSELKAIVNYTKNEAREIISDFRDDLVHIADILDSTAEKSENFNWAFVIAAVFAGLIGLVDAGMMIGIVLAWNKKLKGNCFQKCLSVVRNWFFVPVFVLLIVISFIFSLVFIIGTTATADMCVDSPDPKLLAWLDHNKEEFDRVFYELTSFYLRACAREWKPITVKDLIDAISKVTLALLAVIREIANLDPDVFQTVCGGNFTVLSELAKPLANQICIVSSTLQDVLEFFACDEWQPIYATIMYDAVCYNGVDGFRWIACMQMLIVFFAMIMLTLRAAFYEIEEEEDEETRKRCWARCCGCCVRSPSTHDEENARLVQSSDSNDNVKGVPSLSDTGQSPDTDDDATPE